MPCRLCESWWPLARCRRGCRLVADAAAAYSGRSHSTTAIPLLAAPPRLCRSPTQPPRAGRRTLVLVVSVELPQPCPAATFPSYPSPDPFSKPKTGGLIIAKLPPSNIDQNSEVKDPSSPHFTDNNLSNIPKDIELYKAKRSEALRKYEMTALAGLVVMLHACLDMKAITLGKYHYVRYFLVLAMQFDNRKYSQVEIVEVRVEWANCVLKHM